MRNMKKEDIPIVGGMILSAFKRNKASFINFSSIFDGSFEAEMEQAIQAVYDRRRPADVFDKQKKVTIDLGIQVDIMQEQLRLLGDYVKLAEPNLKTLYKHYHIKKAREALHKNNVEGTINHCQIIIEKIETDDAAALDAVDFNAAKLADFKDLLSLIILLNQEQNDMMDERQDVRADEQALFDTMFDYVNKVISVGKSMYTYKEKQKYDDFSINNILGRINHGRNKKTEEEEEETPSESAIYDVIIGKVTDKMTDQPLENVVVRLEGTEIMVDTDEDGEFYLDEVPSGVYTVSFSKLDYVVGEQHNVEVGTAEMVNLRIELLAKTDSESKTS
jgi:Carboxypeptidase regulatory-like domain